MFLLALRRFSYQYLAKMPYCWYGSRLPPKDSCWCLHPELILLDPEAARDERRAVSEPACQALCMLCLVAQIRRELEPQTWIFSC